MSGIPKGSPLTSGVLQYVQHFEGYQVVNNWWVQTPFISMAFVIKERDFVSCALTELGKLHIYKGFESDGASGPTAEPEKTMPAWISHDAMWRGFDQRKLPPGDTALMDKMSSWCVWQMAYPRWPKSGTLSTALAKIRCTAYEKVLRSRFGHAAAAPDGPETKIREVW